MKQVTLYQFSLCPFCNKVRAGLDIKGIPYTTVEVSPRSKEELPELPEGTPKKVPVLQVGDEVITDSTAILKYLDSAFPDTPAFIPDDQSEQEHTHRIEDWVDEVFIKALPTVLYGTWTEAAQAARVVARESNFSPLQGLGVKIGGSLVMHLVAKRILSKSGRDDAHAWVRENLDKFEEWLGDKPYVCGDDLSLADVAMNGAINCVKEFPIRKEIMRRPVVAAWFQRVEAQKPEAGAALN